MIELGKYTLTVAAAYGIGLMLLALVIAQSLWAGARARQALEAQEKGGEHRG